MNCNSVCYLRLMLLIGYVHMHIILENLRIYFVLKSEKKKQQLHLYIYWFEVMWTF